LLTWKIQRYQKSLQIFVSKFYQTKGKGTEKERKNKTEMVINKTEKES
jgi:hypothetical protein